MPSPPTRALELDLPCLPLPGMGGPRAVLANACAAIAGSAAPALAVVLETKGSTYVASGSIALFDAQTQTGWLSGGCLEPEIARLAALAASTRTLGWMEVDTREDAALLAGAALGCRGRLRLVLLPLRNLDGWSRLGERWLRRGGSMDLAISSNGHVACRVGTESLTWTVRGAPPGWEGVDDATAWNVSIAAPPLAMFYGVGPEAPLLLPLLRAMGWMTHVVEQRPRWIGMAERADAIHRQAPATTRAILAAEQPFAALLMHHNFELDLEALLVASEHPPPYIGLLGPRRRREDLFRLLPEPARERLLPHLHSPAGIDLGGRGPESIALSIAAQLQSHWHAR